uniref:Uncharacterized protein n=1 Tax=Timema douglasi TaxID=61478 RepID=A0A7R8W0Y3_TIMDO|nr:unnamed protein product [Timema douglasi]
METSVVEGPNKLASSESVPSEQDGAVGSDSVDKEKNNVLHCLICNADLAPGTDTTYNVHSALSADDPDLRSENTSVLDHLRRILERPITVHIHSDIVCGECFKLTLEHAAAEVRVRLMRTRVLTRYERTEQFYLALNLKDKNPDKMHRNGLVITQEGTLVDKHGKENNASLFKTPKTKHERKFVCKGNARTPARPVANAFSDTGRSDRLCPLRLRLKVPEQMRSSWQICASSGVTR